MNFEGRVNEITSRISAAAMYWKDYMGAAYSTRVQTVIEFIEGELEDLKDLLKEDHV